MDKQVSKIKHFSKKTGEEISITDPDFDIFFEKFGKKNDKKVSNTDVVFQNAAETMGILLRNHPFFISETERIREEFHLPKNGILSTQHLLWLSESKQRETEFSEAICTLASKFKIPPEMKKSVIRFIQDHVLFDKKECFSPYKTELRFVTKEQIIQDFGSPDVVYLPITPATSIREVKKHLGRLQKLQDKRIVKRYGVPQIDQLGEIVWRKFKEGLKTKEIKTKLAEEYKKKSGCILMEEDVRRLRDRFKKALNKIRPIK